MNDKSVQDFHDLIKARNRKIAFGITAATVLFMVIRLVVTRFYVDEVIHFYKDGGDFLNFILVFFDYAAAACILAVWITSAFIYRYKKEGYSYLAASDSLVQGTHTLVFSSSGAGFMLAFASAIQVYSMLQYNGLPFGDRIITYIKTYPFDFAIIFVSLLCSFYFFKTAGLSDSLNTNSADQTQPAQAKPYAQHYIIFSFMPILWSFLNIFKCFFDMSKSVNSPLRIYELMCFLALSAYFVSEARMIVGRRKISRFFTFAYISVMFVALSALPNLIMSAFWILKTNNSQIIYAVQIAFGFYIASRVYSQIRYSKFLLER